MSTTGFSSLPLELLEQIATELSPSAATSLSLTCKSLYSHIFPTLFWKPRQNKGQDRRKRWTTQEHLEFFKSLVRDLPNHTFCCYCESFHLHTAGQIRAMQLPKAAVGLKGLSALDENKVLYSRELDDMMFSIYCEDVAILSDL